MAALAGDELAQWLEQAVAANELHPGAFALVLHGVGRAGSWAGAEAQAYLARHGLSLYRLRPRRQPAWVRGTQRDGPALERLEARLGRHADERLRRIALAALLEQGDDERGWDDDRLARLRRFAADASPLVAEPALTEFAKVEDERRQRGQ